MYKRQIIKNDELFDSIVPILKERVRAGVEVRILYDGMGGRFMPKRKWKELEAAGIRTACFFPPVLGRLNLRVNYRNHRKIVVIDGHTGYVGAVSYTHLASIEKERLLMLMPSIFG